MTQINKLMNVDDVKIYQHNGKLHFVLPQGMNGHAFKSFKEKNKKLIEDFISNPKNTRK